MDTQRTALVDVDPYASKAPEPTIFVLRRNQAPSGLTKRQLRAMGLRPGGQGPVAEVETLGPRNGLLYRVDPALPNRSMTRAKEYALDRARPPGTLAPSAAADFFTACRPRCASPSTRATPTSFPTPWNSRKTSPKRLSRRVLQKRKSERRGPETVSRSLARSGSTAGRWRRRHPRYVFRGPAMGPLASGPGMTVSPLSSG